ncbi:helix-turn-helix domain-containing protein [Hydrogenophaga intermedia]|uniref:Putative transcriptional regulator n=1 Tax=Hydrogenophaga intermedia TaxID=65786 RepID=A0A1L1PKD4_HYDIT|nr:helix-turn-helix transcriptional regulator [Hydrogenophaga intermedia]TMU72085.1 helix-turn-helix transcriptional regulator [Hydrogenophaga intermedia]CDN88383.1 putative transcriptional regulator [Hydrogenophaga intermedia]
MTEGKTLGKVISEARKAKGMNQKELAATVRREDGESISPQYLNDLEHDRRVPSSEIAQELASVLGLHPDYLLYLARKWPDDLADRGLQPEQFEKAMMAFRKQLSR